MRSYLKESFSVKRVEDLCRQYLLTVWKLWKDRFLNDPEIKDPEYMEPEFNRATYNLGKWIFDQIGKGQFIESVKIAKYPEDAIGCSTKLGRCYYNAVDFVMKNGTKYGDLAFGFFINPNELQKVQDWIDATNKGVKGPRPALFDGLEHAIIIKPNGSIIDPTLDDETRGQILIFERVPESVWRKFKYSPDDEDYNARDFYDEYILKKIHAERKVMNFKAWIDSGG